MTVETYPNPAPDYNDAGQTGSIYPTNLDKALAVLAEVAGAFAVHEAATPNDTLVVDAGLLPTATGALVVNQQTTAAFTFPAANPRIDVIAVTRSSGALYVEAGTETATPTPPELDTRTYRIVAEVALSVGMSIIANANITNRRAAQDQIVYPDVAGHVKGTTEYLESDAGVSPTDFNVGSVVGYGVWESVGPSGSGAANIWTALDAVPNNAKWVKLRIDVLISGSTSGDQYSSRIYLRKTGSSAAADSVTLSAIAFFLNRSGAQEYDQNITREEIPVDSLNRFDVYAFLEGISPVSSGILAYKGACV